MTVDIEKNLEVLLDFNYENVIKQVIDKTLDYEKCPYEAEINILITDNEEIQLINKTNRNIDKATDVLSFPMNEFDEPADFNNEDNLTFNPESGELILGDIVLSVDKIISQAKDYGHSYKRELAFLVAHSMLHLMGYDHIDEDERILMEKKQEEILKQLGITRD